MRTANPALNSTTFDNLVYAERDTDAMSLQGCAFKTLVLLGLVVLSASYTWERFFNAGLQAVVPWVWGGALAGMVLGLVTSFQRGWAPFTSPFYAVAEGLFLGGVSALLEERFKGIAFQAVFLTFGTLLCLLLAYVTRLIRPTENFKLGLAAATGAVFMLYLATFVLSFFGIQMPYIHSGGVIGIAVSAVIVVIAALNLVLDFDFIESGVQRRAPKHMEWYAAFGLLVTLVWLYFEILRLLAKARSNR
ncbi:Bax inhibitor 1 like protein [Phycisphaerae bacterium RAS1]|nr:Bax inhibitor 1 like protein [Phycisphaerae bacterium RAS1]